MDPITTAIITALSELGGNIIKDSYEALKKAITKKYGTKSDLADAVQKLEEKPESKGRQKILEEEVGNSKALEDLQLVKLAELIIQQSNANSSNDKNITQIINGDNNLTSGSGNITINVDRKK